MDARLNLDEFDQAGGTYLVRAPRRTDAVGEALRRVFGAEVRLPPDLTTLVRRLDARRR